MPCGVFCYPALCRPIGYVAAFFARTHDHFVCGRERMSLRQRLPPTSLASYAKHAHLPAPTPFVAGTAASTRPPQGSDPPPPPPPSHPGLHSRSSAGRPPLVEAARILLSTFALLAALATSVPPCGSTAWLLAVSHKSLGHMPGVGGGTTQDRPDGRALGAFGCSQSRGAGVGPVRGSSLELPSIGKPRPHRSTGEKIHAWDASAAARRLSWRQQTRRAAVSVCGPRRRGCWGSGPIIQSTQRCCPGQPALGPRSLTSGRHSLDMVRRAPPAAGSLRAAVTSHTLAQHPWSGP